MKVFGSRCALCHKAALICVCAWVRAYVYVLGWVISCASQYNNKRR